MTQLRLTANPGMEDVLEQEFREKASKAGCEIATLQRKPFNLDGQIFVESSDPKLEDVAFQARSVFHIMRHLYPFYKSPGMDFLDQIYQELMALDIPEMESAKEFRVTTKRSGQHLFNSMEVQQIAGAALVERYGKAVNLNDPDVNVRVDIFDNLCLVSLQLTNYSLSRRHQKVWLPRITIKTTMAYGLLHLCELEGEGRLLDPFCGSGTILIEAGTVFPDLELYGSDRGQEAVAGATANMEANRLSHRVHLKQLDARDLEEGYPPNYFRAIVTNPPYGMHLGPEIDFFRLYLRLLEGAANVLEPGGRLVLLVGKGQRLFKKLIYKLGTFQIHHERIVETGDVYPHLLICDLKEDAKERQT
jgi:putative N6-adenine-specific DNA methylase/tRNA (guanine6-N2)-methyltransferase